jgi:hypothetical protein
MIGFIGLCVMSAALERAAAAGNGKKYFFRSS